MLKASSFIIYFKVQGDMGGRVKEINALFIGMILVTVIITMILTFA